jgi:hypothetical protein
MPSRLANLWEAGKARFSTRACAPWNTRPGRSPEKVWRLPYDGTRCGSTS